MSVRPMPYLLKGGRVIDPASGFDRVADVYLRDGVIEAVEAPGKIAPVGTFETIHAAGLVVAPGLVDMHVHLREPGETHKEDIASGTRAAAAGGVTTVACMPNTKPVLDTPDQIAWVRARAADTGIVKVLPIAALSEGQCGKRLTDGKALRRAGAVALSDDGRPVVSDDLMRAGLTAAAALPLPVVSHCEPETAQALRDIALAEETGCPVHIAHVSRRETLDAVRAARARGVPVTCETCPHYFWFTEADFRRIGANAKMNPPLAAEEDRAAILQGLADGDIQVIASDHAPHHPSEKSGPLERAPNGVVGLETLLAASLTALVHAGRMTLPALLRLLTTAPADLLRVPAGRLVPGRPADLTLFDPEARWQVEARRLASKSQNTPFDGLTLRGRVLHVFVDGVAVVGHGRLLL
ncbi:MAG: dihydroorotase [Oscillospiraceae bacterium]|nr:dihydroorotase [Oscillospiraceae bacterium]